MQWMQGMQSLLAYQVRSKLAAQTPLHSSLDTHIPYVAHHQSDGSDMQAQSTSSSITAPRLSSIITSKRVTRNSVLYEVQFLYVHVSESCMYMSIMYIKNVHRALKEKEEGKDEDRRTIHKLQAHTTASMA